MLDSILDSLFGNKTVTKKVVSSNVSDRTKKRKSIIRKFKNVDPNDNLKRARIAKELLNVSRAEGERRAARKFYKDETALNNLKNRIKTSTSINEKLSLARQGKRLATKKQKEFWENLINKLQKRKQDRNSAVMSKKEVPIAIDKSKEQEKDEDKDMEEIEEKRERDIEENKSEEDSGNDIEEPEEEDENEEEIEEAEEDENENEEDEGEDAEESDNDVNDKDEN